jgi:hypothetical protein
MYPARASPEDGVSPLAFTIVAHKKVVKGRYTCRGVPPSLFAPSMGVGG